MLFHHPVKLEKRLAGGGGQKKNTRRNMYKYILPPAFFKM